jgi:hypothetical protein
LCSSATEQISSLLTTDNSWLKSSNFLEFKMLSRSFALSVLLATIANGDAFSFTSNSLVAHKPTTRTSNLYMGPPVDPTAPITEQMGEGSRKYRRTVYTHAEWVKHRSPDRFVNNLKTLFNSGIYKQISREVIATTSVAAFVCIWNMIAGGYTDLAGVQHGPLASGPFVQMIGLPLTAFTLVSPSLGLLLGELIGWWRQILFDLHEY